LYKENKLGRIKRCVWKIATKPFPEAHFAVFPEELVKQCLDAGCPPNGITLDMFMGSGTVALVALKNAMNFVGIELNPEYITMAQKRIEPYLKQEKLTQFTK
jgi:DNA modification methylase